MKLDITTIELGMQSLEDIKTIIF